jgi:hypothetical protein
MRKGIPAALACVLLIGGALRAQAPACCGGPATPAPSSCLAAPAEPDLPRAWLSADYLLWWVRRSPLPAPLVTTGPFNPNTFVPGVTPTPGALTSPGTVVLFGGQDLSLGTFSGLRLQGGLDLTGDGALAVEGGGFWLERRAHFFTVSSNAEAVPFLSIPVIDATSGTETTVAVAFANDAANTFGGLQGSIAAATTTRLWGSDVNLSMAVVRREGFQVTGLVGFRYLSLDESLGLNEAFTPIGQPLNPGFLGGPVGLGQSVAVADRFVTHNQFYGGQFGARLDYAGELLSVGLTTKVALGGTSQRIDVGGSSALFAPGQAPVVVPGGVLALPSNSGRHDHTAFSVVPEVGLNLGIRLAPWARATVGYTFLYWTDVARPGEQIDRTVDRATVPTVQQFVPGAVGIRPAPLRQQTDFWAQGINFGIELRY